MPAWCLPSVISPLSSLPAGNSRRGVAWRGVAWRGAASWAWSETGRRNHVERSLVHGLRNGTCTATRASSCLTCCGGSRPASGGQAAPSLGSVGSWLPVAPPSIVACRLSPVANPVALLDNSSSGPGAGPVVPSTTHPPFNSYRLGQSPVVFLCHRTRGRTVADNKPHQTNNRTRSPSYRPTSVNKPSSSHRPKDQPAVISPRHSCTSASDSERQRHHHLTPNFPTFSFPHSSWLLADLPARAAWATASPSSS
jgi:hypothetical protein